MSAPFVVEVLVPVSMVVYDGSARGAALSAADLIDRELKAKGAFSGRAYRAYSPAVLVSVEELPESTGDAA